MLKRTWVDWVALALIVFGIPWALAAQQTPPLPCEASLSIVQEELVRLQVENANLRAQIQMAAIGQSREKIVVNGSDDYVWSWERDPQTGQLKAWQPKPKPEVKK